MKTPTTAVPVAMLLAGLLVSSGRAADPYMDDHPDAPADGPTPLSFASGTAVGSGTIELDIDRDVFSFPVTGGKQYWIAVTPSREASGLWDAEVEFGALDGRGTSLAACDSVGFEDAEVIYAQPGGTYRVFLSIGGFAQFTTGAYSVVVSESPIEDLDQDGLPDTWESYYFPDQALTPADTDDPDFDQLTNLQEYYAGTDPTSALSGLAIERIGVEPPIDSLTFSSVPLRVYEIWASPTLMEPTWTAVGSVTGHSSFTTFIIPDDPGNSPQRYYQVRIPIPSL